ncbi:hypothetical protein TSOC_004622, partial [Tetrabaena socialis]
SPKRARPGLRRPGYHFGLPNQCAKRPGTHRFANTLEQHYAHYLSLLRPTAQNLTGLEIGALTPALLPSYARTVYVHFGPAAALSLIYPNISIKAPDIIDHLETLDSIPSGTFDYVLSSHVIQRVPNMLLALQNALRVLRRDGFLLLTIPFLCGTFDKDRYVTSAAHFQEEYEAPHTVFGHRFEHHREWALSHVRGVANRTAADAEIDHWARFFFDLDYPIHFHTFEPRQLLKALQALERPVSTLVHFSHDEQEIRVVLQKE